MLKNTMKMAVIIIGSSMMMTSCYTYTTVAGNGAQGNSKVTKWNHYVIAGLAPVSVSDSKQMADGSKDYTVVTQRSFVNGLIGAITWGLYTPTTTTVTK